MSYVNVAIQVGSAAYGLYNANKNKQSGVNISDVIKDAQSQATQDLQNSINLENQFLPGTAALRQNANQLNLNLSSGNTAGQRAQNALLGQAGSPITDPNSAVNNPLTVGSLNSILQSLNKGGQLDPDVQAQAAQAALQGAGTAGISGSGAGRGLVARDLGLTSLQLLQSRQNQALQAGNSYGALQLQGQQLQLQDYMSRLQGVNSAVSSTQQYGLGLGALMNNTQYPTSGLSPTQVASLLVGNTNISNAVGQQTTANTASTLNTLGGIASLFANNGGGTTIGSSGATGTITGSGGAPTSDVDTTSFGSMFCWVAREVYGENNPKWRQFRTWMLECAPKWFFNLYKAHGEKFAAWLKGRETIKNIIRMWMNGRIHSCQFA